MSVAVILEPIEKARVPRGSDLGGTKFSMSRHLDLSAQLRGHGLHAVADTKHRHSQRVNLGRRFETLDVVNGFRAAGENDRFRREFLDVPGAGIAGVDFGIHAEFADSPSDQLCVLSTEIENQNSVRMNVGHQPIR